MASRRCLLRLLSGRLVPHGPQPHAQLSIATRTLTSLPQPLAPATSRPIASPRLFYPSRCHFATRSSGDEEEDEDDEEHYDDEGSEGGWGDEEEAVAAKKPSGKTEEEKVAEAAEIGYRVVGPLGSDEKPFKPYEPVFAVVQIGSHQFKVSNGDSIFTERLKFCDVNDKLILNRVLMLGSQTQTVIGRPILPDATVHAVVEEHKCIADSDLAKLAMPEKLDFLICIALDAKVIIFKKKRRKNYRRTKGHRQELTKLRITNIEGIDKSDPVAVAA
ncbi:hypothetical protein ACP4OV_021544 [Aristida adscensionis]